MIHVLTTDVLPLALALGLAYAVYAWLMRPVLAEQHAILVETIRDHYQPTMPARPTASALTSGQKALIQQALSDALDSLGARYLDGAPLDLDAWEADVARAEYAHALITEV